MEILLDEALDLVEDADGGEGMAARRYWYGQIMCSLGSEEYPTYATTMQNAIDTLKKLIDSTTSLCDDVNINKEQGSD